jgi:hypothetical protein
MASARVKDSFRGPVHVDQIIWEDGKSDDGTGGRVLALNSFVHHIVTPIVDVSLAYHA